MLNNPGKFIVLDGIDGSGKMPQLWRIKTRLEREGQLVEVADWFPLYSTNTSLSEVYLNDYQFARKITPYQATVFHALDRLTIRAQILDWLAAGRIVLTNRYTTANLARFGGQLTSATARQAYYEWALELEYDIFHLPRPDIVLIIDLDADLAIKTLEGRLPAFRMKNKVLRARLLKRLNDRAQVYREATEHLPQAKILNVMFEGQKIPDETITLKLMEHIHDIINEVATGSTLPAPEVDKIESVKTPEPTPEPEAQPVTYNLLSAENYTVFPTESANIQIRHEINIPKHHLGIVYFPKTGQVVRVLEAGADQPITLLIRNHTAATWQISLGTRVANLVIIPMAKHKFT